MAVDDYYKYFEEKCIKPGAIDYNDFELVDEKLRFKGSSIDLINKSTGKPLALTSIKGQQGGSDLLELYEYLNIKLSQNVVAALNQSSGEITQLSARAETVEMEELPVIVQQVDDSVALVFRGTDVPIEGQ